MSRFFINHPVFAWVIAILISLCGVLAILNLGVESYPSIAPPQVTVSTSYPGASAETAEGAVTQVIEQQLTGIDNLVYFSSSSSSSGGSNITLTFEPGTDPDIAQVQVQNKVAARNAAPARRGDAAGRRRGQGQRGLPDGRRVCGPKTSRWTATRSATSSVSRVLDQIARVPGVGSTQQFGSEYAMNIWLNPDKLRGYGLSATDVLTAVRGAERAVRRRARSAATRRRWTRASPRPCPREGRFSTPEQFGNIILRTTADGATVRLRDVARVEPRRHVLRLRPPLGRQARRRFRHAARAGRQRAGRGGCRHQAHGRTAGALPEGRDWFSPYDSSTFVADLDRGSGQDAARGDRARRSW